MKNKFISKIFFITLLSIFLTSCNVNAPNNIIVPEQKEEMQIIRTEKYSAISFGGEVSSQSIGVPDEAINHKGELIINYLDVGQADSTFIMLPNGETLLIDCGEINDSEFIKAYIKGCKKDTLDYVIATHPHEDHIGGMSEILKAFDVKNIYMTNAVHTTDTFDNLLDTIAENGMKIKRAKAGVKLFEYENLSAEFIAPNNDSYADLNNYSAVIMLKYKENKFLFMGDAEIEVENEILSSGYDIKADILKVGHHGSSTSSTDSFIKAVSPKYSIISCNRNNSYRHPEQQTLTTLKNNKVEIYRTDLQSTVVAVSDGINVTLNTNYHSIETNAPPSQEPPPLPSPTAEPQKKVENPTEKTVYITKTGKKFHAENCKYLAKSKIAIDLEEAKKNYDFCSICKP